MSVSPSICDIIRSSILIYTQTQWFSCLQNAITYFITTLLITIMYRRFLCRYQLYTFWDKSMHVFYPTHTLPCATPVYPQTLRRGIIEGETQTLYYVIYEQPLIYLGKMWSWYSWFCGSLHLSVRKTERGEPRQKKFSIRKRRPENSKM